MTDATVNRDLTDQISQGAIKVLLEQRDRARAALELLRGPSDGGRRMCWCGPDWDHGYHTNTCGEVEEALTYVPQR